MPTAPNSGTASPTCRFVTYGCKVNQYDTQALREDLLSRGWREVSGSDPADVALVDTCTVTETAAREALRRIRRLAGRPGAQVVVTGCLVLSHREVLESIPGVLMLAPNEAKSKLGEALSGMGLEGRSPASPAGGIGRCMPAFGQRTPLWLEGDPAETFRLGIRRFAGRTRAFVKVQDGCSLACAYCIVPKVRGPSRSRPAGEAIDEARRLLDAGYRELVLTGIHLGSYGQDLPGRSRLFDLVARLLEISGDWRLRLSSIEAHELREPDLAVIADGARAGRVGRPHLCPHLHLPLQSGSEEILRRMRRPHALAEFERTAAELRARVADLAITTDLLVGFPGESDADFEATRAAARRLSFSRIHAFPYSARPGTAAAGLPGALPPAVLKARMRALARPARESAAAFHRRFVGRSVQVLVEERPDRATGRPCGYSEHYVRVLLEPGTPRGGLVAARVTGADAAGCTAGTELRVPCSAWTP